MEARGGAGEGSRLGATTLSVTAVSVTVSGRGTGAGLGSSSTSVGSVRSLGIPLHHSALTVGTLFSTAVTEYLGSNSCAAACGTSWPWRWIGSSPNSLLRIRSNDTWTPRIVTCSPFVRLTPRFTVVFIESIHNGSSGCVILSLTMQPGLWRQRWR